MKKEVEFEKKHIEWLYVLLVIGALALLFDLGMRWLERKLVPWKGRG